MGLGVVVLSDAPVTGGPCRVEVTQGREPETVGPIVVPHHVLHVELGAAVGVDRVLGVIVRYGNLGGFPVGRARGGEDDVPHSGRAHLLEQGPRVVHVLVVVDGGVGDRLTHVALRGEVNHGHWPVVAKGRTQRIPVSQVRLDQGAGDGLSVPGREVVQNHHVDPPVLKGPDRVASDVARSTRNQNRPTDLVARVHAHQVIAEPPVAPTRYVRPGRPPLRGPPRSPARTSPPPSDRSRPDHPGPGLAERSRRPCGDPRGDPA